MKTRDFHGWMWGEALALLEQAERVQRHFFQSVRSQSGPIWEPPVDLVESEQELCLQVALPGVEAGDVQVVTGPGWVVVSAVRIFPERLPDMRIHRLEIPCGRFERRISLPVRVRLTGRSLVQGMLTLVFSKILHEREVA